LKESQSGLGLDEGENGGANPWYRVGIREKAVGAIVKKKTKRKIHRTNLFRSCRRNPSRVKNVREPSNGLAGFPGRAYKRVRPGMYGA